jgi:hypothetical protein
LKSSGHVIEGIWSSSKATHWIKPSRIEATRDQDDIGIEGLYYWMDDSVIDIDVLIIPWSLERVGSVLLTHTIQRDI